MIKVYEYSNCSTCKQALKYLDAIGAKYERIAIVETPPTPAELKKMLGFIVAAGGSLKNLFNTSGVQYRELDMAAKLNAGIKESDALTLLSKNGKLIKRPFLLTDEGGTVGFRKENWDALVT